MAKKKSTATKSTKSSAKKPARKKASASKEQLPTKQGVAGVIETSLSGDARAMVEQVVRIAEDLDEDGLALLLEQAKVVSYKGKIEKFNREINLAAGRAAEARRVAATPDYSVAIERTEDDFFIIQLDQARIFFNRSEMREITRICHKSKDATDAGRRLYRWFDAERRDLLFDAGINSPRSRYFPTLYEMVINTYKVKS